MTEGDGGLDGKSAHREKGMIVVKQALLVVSCGTAVPIGRTDIALIEKALASETPGRDFFRAFTNPSVRQAMKDLGEQIPSLPEAFGELEKRGYRDVLLQPTHILYGYEYDKMMNTAKRYIGRFEKLTFGSPLLSDHSSLIALAEALARRHLGNSQCASVFFGHGSAHFANMVYPALQTALRLIGNEHSYVGTVKGWPGYEEVLRQLETGGYQEVRLVPLLLAAGGTTFQEMAGKGPESWQTKLKDAGFTVRPVLQGLGALPEVQQIYRTQLRQLIMQEGLKR